ncbi:MAG: ribonuclease J [Thermales bacterium]|nr:ribonuclease J [Thermales bacterium]
MIFIPDTSYLEQNRHKIRGLIYTHGHLDHIGGAPYILPKLGDIPIYSMPLTLALLKNRLQEFEMQNKFQGKIIDLDKPLTLGVFTFHPFRLNHSIPDVIGLGIDTPMGRILYCTDWKFDNTPFDGQLSDYGKIAQLGDGGVRLLLTDSLGILKPGYAISESEIQKTIFNIFKQAQGRVIVTTFSTTIARLQHTINACEKFNRKLALIGRSMINNFNVCAELGYIKVPPGMIMDIRETDKLPPEKFVSYQLGRKVKTMLLLLEWLEMSTRCLDFKVVTLFSSLPSPFQVMKTQFKISLLSFPEKELKSTCTKNLTFTFLVTLVTKISNYYSLWLVLTI